MKCPGPAWCPYASEQRFRLVIALVMMLLVLMSAIAICAVWKGKDGILTGATTAAMATTVTGVLLGGLHRHRPTDQAANEKPKGGD
jgi:hypothetical protein